MFKINRHLYHLGTKSVETERILNLFVDSDIEETFDSSALQILFRVFQKYFFHLISIWLRSDGIFFSSCP